MPDFLKVLPMRAPLLSLLFACGAALALPAHSAEKLLVTASHTLEQARPSETISIAWTDVNNALPGALVQKIAVKDAAGRVLAHQVTNVAPLAKDPQGRGAAYGELLFQHSFAAGEKSASFSVEKIDGIAPPFPVKAYARYIPERLDDFAWETDRLGHRIYGQALSAPALPGSGKEVLRSSGVDIWFKRVEYPIVDRWYNKGHDHYHKDQGEGLDMYNVRRSRGAGGTGIWDGQTLHTSDNYKTWKILANGPLRVVFELTYEAWDAAGLKVTELKRFTADAGHLFEQMDSTFTFDGPAHITAAIGLNKDPADKRENATPVRSESLQDPSLSHWIAQKNNGDMGVAIILPSASGFAEDAMNHLITAPVTSGKPLRYYLGATWVKAGPVQTADAWRAAIAFEALRRQHPLKVSFAAAP